MSGRHRSDVVVPEKVSLRAELGRHPVLLGIVGVWALVAVGVASSVSGQDHGGASEWWEFFGATFGVPLFFLFLIGLPLGLYVWLVKKITDRFPRATALVLSYGAGKAAAEGEPVKAALYAGGAYQSAKTAAERRGEEWVGSSSSSLQTAVPPAAVPPDLNRVYECGHNEFDHTLFPEYGGSWYCPVAVQERQRLGEPDLAAMARQQTASGSSHRSPTAEAVAAGLGAIAGHAANLREQRQFRKEVELERQARANPDGVLLTPEQIAKGIGGPR